MIIFKTKAELREYVEKELYQREHERFVDRQFEKLEEEIHKLEFRVTCLENRFSRPEVRCDKEG